MDQVRIDVETIRQGARELQQAKDDVHQAFEGFATSLEGYANAFGGDEIGMLLGVAHQACLDAASECFTTNVAELENYADSLNRLADTYQQAEEEATASFKALLDALGG